MTSRVRVILGRPVCDVRDLVAGFAAVRHVTSGTCASISSRSSELVRTCTNSDTDPLLIAAIERRDASAKWKSPTPEP